ncbi:hypothetical protein B5C26_02165 [Photorhabdus luminescens]|uniref:Uncharacterized protein n=1 Tax=Photorhabdus luminescens subsp. mexicana TaxID=2100167 RepID=A0A4R4JQF7_PHOLU|nr:hypothetical protein B5C26_02165 [Photorhabdus luminescens]TDB56262.1 hypothetical protein C5468_00790 [Photorhabdus luminescens subsp. mexicana]
MKIEYLLLLLAKLIFPADPVKNAFLLSFGLLNSSYCGITFHFSERATCTALLFISFGAIWLLYPYLYYGYIKQNPFWVAKSI